MTATYNPSLHSTISPSVYSTFQSSNDVIYFSIRRLNARIKKSSNKGSASKTIEAHSYIMLLSGMSNAEIQRRRGLRKRTLSLIKILSNARTKIYCTSCLIRRTTIMVLQRTSKRILNCAYASQSKEVVELGLVVGVFLPISVDQNELTTVHAVGVYPYPLPDDFGRARAQKKENNNNFHGKMRRKLELS